MFLIYWHSNTVNWQTLGTQQHNTSKIHSPVTLPKLSVGTLSVWLSQSQCHFGPTPFGCCHLFDTMSGANGLGSQTETTAATQRHPTVKL